MQIMEILRGAQDGMAFENLAAAFEADPRATAAAVELVVPEIADRIERNTLSRGGLAELVRALGDPRHRRALSDPTVFVDPTVGQDGTAILGHVFGTRDAVRGAAMRVAQSTGLGPDVAERMLPYIAALTMSGISKALIDALGSNAGRIPGLDELPRGGGSDAPAGGGQQNGSFLPRGASRPGGYELPRPAQRPVTQSGPPYQLPEITGAPDVGGAPMPRGSGGSPLPGPLDVGRGQRGGGGYRLPEPEQQPYPMPGPAPGSQPAPGNNPLDDLSDILRRRGATTNDGSPLGGIIRSILGGILGFGGRGMMSWLFRLIFFRFGWTILKRVIGRTLTGR